ncbi:MAG: GNAT family N-acetyltransferase [Deltaproteobacteria bacterium]|nr:GNAT family N-acetyltransferase [Deltaproteobacteria bacterium]
MAMSWIADSPPTWNDDKQRLVGEATEGIFDRRFQVMKPGDLAPGSWWRVEDDGKVVGYGWLDVVWGDAEILLVTDPDCRGRGVGSFILEHLAKEAESRGLNYLYNTVRPSHPNADALTAWLLEHGFSEASDGSLVRPSAQRVDTKASEISKPS